MTDYKQKVESLNEQIAKVKHQIEIEQHRYIRQKNSLKRQIAKERNHRMIFCTGRIEYHLKNRLNITEDEQNGLDVRMNCESYEAQGIESNKRIASLGASLHALIFSRNTTIKDGFAGEDRAEVLEQGACRSKAKDAALSA